MHRFIIIVVLALSCGMLRLSSASAAPAGQRDAAATVKVEASEFESLIDRVRQARVSGDWQRPGWAGAAEIDKALQALLEDVKQASGRPDLQVGTPLAGLQPGGGGNVGPRVSKALYVLRDGNVGFAEASVFLAEGNVRVSFANDCVIIAGGAVEVAHGSRNLIVAGHYVNVSHDASPRPGRQGSAGSVILSGQLIDVAHARGSVCASPGAVRVSHASGVTFVNSPNVEVSHQDNCREVADARLGMAPPKRANPLEGVLKITQVVEGDERRARRNGRREARRSRDRRASGRRGHRPRRQAAGRFGRLDAFVRR